MGRLRLVLSCLLAIVVGLGAACSQKSAATKTTQRCTPGNYVFCRCKDRSEGTKLCNDDGDSFGACEGCLGGTDNQPGDPEPPPTDEPPPPPPPPGEDASTKKDSGATIVDSGPPPAPHPKVGELFISEIMFDPSGSEPAEEWFEVVSIASSTVSLNGMLIRDAAGRTHGIDATPAILLAPLAHKVLVRNKPAAIATGVPSASIVFEYGTGDPDTGGVLLSNSPTAGISLLDGATEIVKVLYGAFDFTQSPPGGASIQLKVPSAATAGSKTGWCLSTIAWAGQPAVKNPKDKGSPGEQSNCP